MTIRQISVGSSEITVRELPETNIHGKPELWASPGEYSVYDAFLYHLMSNDHTRNQAYQRAIKANAPGQSIVDIGTGQDANWALASVEAGAQRVYAIEEIEDAYSKAAEKIRRLGLDDYIALFYGSSMRVSLPAQVDVCVSEIIGTIASSEGMATVLRDARERFLKPNGRIVPQRCLTRIAAACLPDELHLAPGFTADAADYLERVFDQVGHPFDPRLCITNFPSECIISNDEIFEMLDFTGKIQTEYDNAASLKIQRSSRLNGFLLWINLWCADGAEPIDSLKQKTSWLPVFLPVFYPGVDVGPADRIETVCRTRVSDDGIHPDYEIEGQLLRADGRIIKFDLRMLHHGHLFRQNSFYRALFPQ
jgi:ubiquinone/menaquinone biosynthesis C-methylase UbiE